MSAMEHSTVDTPSAADTRRPQFDAATYEQYTPHFRPGLAKGPILPAWLRKRLRREDTPR
jgi:hypothetical protein